MPLTDTATKALAPRASMYKVTVGEGLQLHITPQGSKLWRLAYRFDGKQKLMALGRYPDLTVKDARVKARAAKLAVSEGSDPMATRKADKVARRLAVENAFAAVAKLW